MEIDLQTKVVALLEAYSALEETLLQLSPAFAKLRNPVLRRTVAKVATLQQAAKIAGISPVEMVRTLRRAVGLATENIAAENNPADDDPETPPTWFDAAKIAVRFDASPVIEAGQSPMQDIIRLSGRLQANEIMELTTPFKPVPIIDLLISKGFKAWYHHGKSYICR